MKTAYNLYMKTVKLYSIFSYRNSLFAI